MANDNKRYIVIPDGNPDVPFNYTFVAATPNGGPAGISTLALHYSFNAGWRFFDVSFIRIFL